MEIGACFRCHEPATFAWFYDDSVGHFPVGGEPRLCKSCDLQLRAMPIAQRRTALASFETMKTPPTNPNPIAEAKTREREFKRRGRA